MSPFPAYRAENQDKGRIEKTNPPMRLEKALKIQTRDHVTFNFCHYVSCILYITIMNAIPKGKKP